ncbi:glycosyltransferase family 25 protein [Rudanella lutea]|uniref:glycosyltransferase family 25 protein n=1 Tax=Rudanella lutea TaxID=451374 RepID=UPI00037628C2|nr:glycosyltransferase family 25 protein [Rudanella lutea]
MAVESVASETRDAWAALNDYFDKIYVISLRRATDRHARFRELLRGLNYDIYWAVDKLDIDRDDMIRQGLIDDVTVREPRYIHPEGLMTGEIACALSHRAIYEEMVREGYERVLIFEDDVVPCIDRLNQLPRVLEQLPARWDLLYLGYTKNEELNTAQRRKQWFYNLVSPLGVLRWSRREARNYLPRTYSANLRRAGLHDCTHAYAVTRAGARKLADAQRPLLASADSIISVLVLNEQLDAYVSVPVLFGQAGESYIN